MSVPTQSNPTFSRRIAVSAGEGQTTDARSVIQEWVLDLRERADRKATGAVALSLSNVRTDSVAAVADNPPFTAEVTIGQGEFTLPVLRCDWERVLVVHATRISVAASWGATVRNGVALGVEIHRVPHAPASTAVFTGSPSWTNLQIPLSPLAPVTVDRPFAATTVRLRYTKFADLGSLLLSPLGDGGGVLDMWIDENRPHLVAPGATLLGVQRLGLLQGNVTVEWGGFAL